MPLVNLDTVNATLTHLCSLCATEHTVDLADLVIGYRTSPDQIVLPPCGCGAQEIIIRPVVDDRPGAQVIAARHLAHALAMKLIDDGNIRPVADPGDPDYPALVAAGGRIGDAATANYAECGVTDCANYADVEAMTVVNAEARIAADMIARRITAQTTPPEPQA